MAIYTREQWGAAPPKAPLTTAPGPGDSLVIHHTGGGPAPASVADAMSMLRGIQASHQSGEYVDIAYNMAADQFGNLYILRGMEYLGGATYGANAHTRAMVWLGSSDVDVPTNLALRAIGDFYRSELGRNLSSTATVTGHRDWTSTACPGEVLYGLLDTIRYPKPEQEEEDMMATWVTPGGLRYVMDLRTGASRTSTEAFPAGTANVEAKIQGLIASGAMKDWGAMDWEQNWIIRTSPTWPVQI